jgi:hypothetical protein
VDDILTSLHDQMTELDVEAELGPLRILAPALGSTALRLSRGSSRQEYTLLAGRAVRFADLAKDMSDGGPRFVYTAFTGPRTADALRRAHVQHLDTAGNAWIEFGDVLIDVRGRRPSEPVPSRGPGGSANLFSAARAQVIFALLAWPPLWEASRRDLARTAGVSVGQAHSALRLIQDAGYGPRPTTAQQTDLLSLWSASYPTGLAKRLALATYRGDLKPLKAATGQGPYYVSGESVIDEVLRPASLTLYVPALDPQLAIAHRWRSDGAPNIIVRRQFWTTPDDSENPKQGRGLRTAPWPLVYADLLSSDDPRVRSAAPEWRERHEHS